MATKRKPIRREMRRRISAEAIEAYRLAREIAEGKYSWERDGGRRRQYLNTWRALHRALGLKPWEVSPLDAGEGDRPGHLEDLHGWEVAQQIRLALEQFGDLHGDEAHAT